MNLNKLAFYVLICFVVIASCAKYSFRGALPSNLETLYIEDIRDQTNYPGARENFMQQLSIAFIADNSLIIIEDKGSADLILSGTITSVQRRPISIDPTEAVQQYQMVLTVKMECLNTHTDKPLWAQSISRYGIISGTALRDEIDQAILFAMEQIVEDIISLTIGAW